MSDMPDHLKPDRMTGCVHATQTSTTMFALLGGRLADGVGFSHSEIKRLRRVYGFEEMSRATFDAEMSNMHEANLQRSRDDHQKYRDWVATPREKREVSYMKKPPPFPKPPDRDGLWEMKQAGEFRNLARHVKIDGMRVMLALSEFLEPGQDPVAFLAEILAEVGFDTHNFGEFFEDPY